MPCSTCGTENRAGSRFCDSCGTPLSTAYHNGAWDLPGITSTNLPPNTSLGYYDDGTTRRGRLNVNDFVGLHVDRKSARDAR